MTPEQSAALRKPFPREAVGILPKPYKADSPKGKCPQCGGFHGMPAAHLDYVGHAAVTDRLLAVDPAWSWEPFALTAEGLPALDRGGNLWIKLTVGGVTRLGVGDGKNAKEIIGDAIRNAAMRFGVALDLWSKEELEGVETHVERPSDATRKPAQPAVPPAAPPTTHSPAAADTQRKRMHALLGELGITDRDKYVALAAWSANRAITSTSDLNAHEVAHFIDYLAQRVAHDKEATK